MVNEFEGVQLGWSKDEVFFRIGKPAQFDSTDDKHSKSQFLSYDTVIFELENNKVIRIIFDCDTKEYSYEKLGGISCDTDVNRVAELYGESRELSISDDKLSRIYNYQQYNLAFVLSKSKVQSLMVFDGIHKPNGFHFAEQKSNLGARRFGGKI